MSEYQLMTEDQRDMVKLVKDFLMKEYLPHVSEYEAKGEYPLEFHKKLGELGLFAMDVPEEYGGLGLDAVTTCLIREAIGYVDAGFASSFAASTFGIKPVLLAGTEEQKKAYGARLAEGQISAMCLTEPQSGSDMGNTKCRAVKDGDEYVLNGTKCFITNGGIADIYTVAASTSPELGSAGISLFIVDRNTPGVSVGKEEDKLGIRTSNTTDVIFQDAHVSGHACQEELKLIYSLVKPKYAVPIHGEYRHRKANAKLAESLGIPKENIFMLQSGDVLEVSEEEAKVVDKVHTGEVLVDGLGVGDVGNIVLRDRQHLAEDGILIVVMTLEKGTNQLLAGPDIVSRGFVYVRESEGLMEDARHVLEEAVGNYLGRQKNADWSKIKLVVRDTMNEFIWKRTKRRPMILPIIMDV